MQVAAATGVVHWVDTPDAVRLRAVYFTGAGRGTVLLLNGRTEFVERYDEPVAALCARGYDVWTMDWRGQGASGRLLPDPAAHHVGRFEDYVADVELLLDQVVRPRAPLVLIGFSMGGHVAVRLLLRRPEAFARAVLLAPMIGFLPGPVWGHHFARLLAEVVCRVPGLSRRYGPGPARAPMTRGRFEGNRLTNCEQRFEAGLALNRAYPDLAVGGVTWGWLRAALASVGVLRRAGSVGVPTLMVLAGDERVVDNAAARRWAAGQRCVKVIDLPGARHELLRERDDHRAALWAAMDEFLGQPGLQQR